MHTLMTSKGCVARVATAPADAADALWISAAWLLDVAGMRYAEGQVSGSDEGRKEGKDEQASRLIPS